MEGRGLLETLLYLVIKWLTTAIYYALQPFWLHLWPPLQVLYLICKRVLLRANNITAAPTLPPASSIKENGTPPDTRTFEGSLNSHDRPTMAMTGCPFMRNTRTQPGLTALDSTLGGPDPVQVSGKLLARPNGHTKTRPLVNLLGGAWIQFMIHDWFELKKDQTADPVDFQRPDGKVMSLKPAVKNAEGRVINNHDHWWSGSQIYGSTPASNRKLRTGVDGKMLLNNEGTYLSLDENGVEKVGFNVNLWSGLQLLHLLFHKEHNAVCDMLKQKHPDWDDDKLFSVARLIITALIARIQTVEWSTAIVQHPAGRAGQYFVWYGILGALFGRKLMWLTKFLRRFPTTVGQFLCGIPGSNTVMAGDNAAFAHSEEFIMVYRMHSLLPEKVEVVDSQTEAPLAVVGLGDVIFGKGTQVNTSLKLQDLLYSFGIGHAGALELRNYPTALRNLQLPPAGKAQWPSGQDPPQRLLDMGAVDVWRSRESRIPLFNDYLKNLSLPPYRSFDKLGLDDVGARAALREVYSNDVNKIDAMVGMLAETPLPGWIFGEAIYSIFILQTQRRLEGDRFYTQDFAEEFYTREGLDWVENTTMSVILRRHVPQLAHWLQPDTNAFIPWKSTEKRRLHEKVFWDLLFPGQVFGWLRAMGYKWR